MAYPSWSDGSTTVQFSIGATTPLVPSVPVPRQVTQELTDNTIQVADIGPHGEDIERVYTGLPLAEFAAFIALYQGATVNFRGYPVTYVDEDSVSRSVRLMQVARTRRENGDYDLTILMRVEPS